MGTCPEVKENKNLTRADPLAWTTKSFKEKFGAQKIFLDSIFIQKNSTTTYSQEIMTKYTLYSIFVILKFG